MKNKLALFSVLIGLILLGGTALAQGNPGQGNGNQGNQNGQLSQGTPGYQGGQNQNQNQNQVQQMNQGEEQQIRQETQEQEQEGQEAAQPEEQETDKAAQTIQSLDQTIKEIKDSLPAQSQIREQVQTRLREMIVAQEDLQTAAGQQLKQLQSRGSALKFLIGPNYGAINRLEKQIEANQVRIQELTVLKEQAANQGEQTVIQQTIDALNQESVALQNAISEQSKTFSLFGWLAKLFVK